MNNLKSIPLISNSKTPPAGCKWTDKKHWTIWNKTIKTNAGILTGNHTKGKTMTEHNNNITVVDIDVFKHPEVSSKFLQTYGKSIKDIVNKFNTFSVKSVSKCLHLYFKYTPSLPSTLNNTHHIDILNNGRYVVAPNSSIGKRTYKIIKNVEPVEMPKDLQEFLKDLLYDKKTIKKEAEKKTKKNKLELMENDKSLSFWIPNPEEVLNNLPQKYFNDFNLWMKMTTFAKQNNLKDLWDEKSKMGDNYNKLINFELWNKVKTNVFITDELLKASTQIPPIYYKFKDIEKQIIQPDIIINKTKLGYTFFNDLLKEYPDKNCIIVKSDTGTGKTTSLGQYLKDTGYKFISLVSRVSLGAEQYENVFSSRFGLKSSFYLNTEGAFKTGQNVVIQLESITRLSNIKFDEYVIFLDELNSLLEHLITSSTFSHHRTLVFSLLIKIVKQSKMIIGTDADISDICIKFMEYCQRDVLYIQNTYKHNEGVKAEEINDFDELVNELKTLNKYIVCCDSKTEVDKLAKQINDENVKVFTSDTLTDSIKLDDFDKVIFSPKIIYGLDSSMVRPVFCIFNNMTISPAQMLQQIARSRNISYLKYCFLKKNFWNSRYENKKECFDFLKDTRECSIAQFELMKENHTDIYLQLLATVEYKNDCFNVNKLCWFKKLLFERGFNDTQQYFQDTKINTEMNKQMKAEIKEERLLNYKKFVSRVNKYLNIPEDKLQEYAELFIDPYKLQQHFNIRKFFFNMTTTDAIKEHIKKHVEDFAVNIASSNDGKMNFLMELLKECNETIKYDKTFKENQSIEQLLNKEYDGYTHIFNPTIGLSKENSKIFLTKYTQAYRVRVKTLVDFTKLDNVNKIMKKCYKNLFGDVVNSSTTKKGERNNRKIITTFNLSDEQFKYHQTLVNFSKSEGDNIDDLDFIE